MESHLDNQRAVSSNICTFVLVDAINRLPAQMRRARRFTRFLGVFMRDDISRHENERGNPGESRTLGQSGEGLVPPGR